MKIVRLLAVTIKIIICCIYIYIYIYTPLCNDFVQSQPIKRLRNTITQLKRIHVACTTLLLSHLKENVELFHANNLSSSKETALRHANISLFAAVICVTLNYGTIRHLVTQCLIRHVTLEVYYNQLLGISSRF